MGEGQKTMPNADTCHKKRKEKRQRVLEERKIAPLYYIEQGKVFEEMRFKLRPEENGPGGNH